MAQRVNIVLTDDLDSSGETSADETVTFGLDGTQYEIDLSKKNAAGLRKALAMYVEHGRKVSGKAKSTSSRGKSNAAEIRAWAKSNGIDVPERGRIPESVRAQFDGK